MESQLERVRPQGQPAQVPSASTGDLPQVDGSRRGTVRRTLGLDRFDELCTQRPDRLLRPHELRVPLRSRGMTLLEFRTLALGLVVQCRERLNIGVTHRRREGRFGDANVMEGAVEVAHTGDALLEVRDEAHHCAFVADQLADAIAHAGVVVVELHQAHSRCRQCLPEVSQHVTDRLLTFAKRPHLLLRHVHRLARTAGLFPLLARRGDRRFGRCNVDTIEAIIQIGDPRHGNLVPGTSVLFG